MKKIAVYLINKYQKISKYTPKVCREILYPSCSIYKTSHNTVWLFERMLYGHKENIGRCNFFDGGYDPIDNGGNNDNDASVFEF